MHNIVFLPLLYSSIYPVFVPHYLEYRSKCFTRFTLRVNNHSINCESDENWYEPYHYKSHTLPGVICEDTAHYWFSEKRPQTNNIRFNQCISLEKNKFNDNNMLFYVLFFGLIRLKKNLKKQTNNYQRLQLEYSKYLMWKKSYKKMPLNIFNFFYWFFFCCSKKRSVVMFLFAKRICYFLDMLIKKCPLVNQWMFDGNKKMHESNAIIRWSVIHIYLDTWSLKMNTR